MKAMQKSTHEFLPEDSAPESGIKLFKDYAILRFRSHNKNTIGLRWRSRKDVISGKGKVVCANEVCKAVGFLRSYEVPFTYMEKSKQKKALVKIKLCKTCGKRMMASA
mmetsp:Transcript_26306/g.36668  ORF Transcript_26306/g.36668 Transcript_26306/m.36668 type:complete len:108 (+) Transcript_26306:227-550(+)|eukprot:CAMPEP_0184479168 /NCGR_PEP_ID=MMETSP0113_2-20130426/998_1 /TAXON_ID=91329 /ORGANISM="Norrisiella sphaerica, Strain BC52" /LENGTH=107 /DNA_ID=CAMNT_0026857189 /DNA_START=191 /DNA_END=514 /DNA_ORIENTATION=+